MSTVVMTVPASARPAPKRKRAVLVCGRLSLTLPCTSPEARVTGIGSEWTQIPRPGERPLLRKAGERLRQLELDVYFADELGSRDAEHDVDTLDAMSSSDEPIVVVYGKLEAGHWRLTDVTPTSKRREAGTNRVTRLDATLTFQEAVLGDIRGPSVTATKIKPPPKPSTKKKPAPRTRTYVVKRGDTLSRIAAHFYHDANQWQRIAKANKIRNPNRITVGQRLTIP